MKSKKGRKRRSKNKNKHNIPVKVKKELKILTKEWFDSLSNKKKLKSKKKIYVNKFINSIKKKCKDQYPAIYGK